MFISRAQRSATRSGGGPPDQMDKGHDHFQAPTNPFGDPFGHEANVELYQPPDIRSGPWQGGDDGPVLADDDAYDEPFSAAHLAAAHEASVPAVPGPVVSQPQQAAPLAFTGEAGGWWDLRCGHGWRQWYSGWNCVKLFSKFDSGTQTCASTRKGATLVFKAPLS